MSKVDRRSFLQTTALAGVGLATTASAKATTEAAGIIKEFNKEKIRIGFLGVGLRGRSHIDLCLRRNDCEVVAVNDIDQVALDQSVEMCTKAGRSQPTVYGTDEKAYLELLEKETLDAVVIASPWRWHSEMAIAAMKKGIYVGTEVCGGFSLDECWQLVNAHEETGTHLFFMENVCYRRDVMAVLNMARQDMFGKMIHLEGGYQHDLRHVKFNDGKKPYGGGVEFGKKGSVSQNGEQFTLCIGTETSILLMVSGQLLNLSISIAEIVLLI